ncbi:OLC1v1000567C2 [Oldenlandia corymbosa var. corymbosa]|uniref:OLC1v1000567C2 n=2 Tax=Oldenlandia corymbosa var. corymbosa TaxID=529605 RepID=A0AAV1D3A7_OLDCO|nr:OLC1v1000567C2 [Oldenlandia corymbosa var. corymbosa]
MHFDWGIGSAGEIEQDTQYMDMAVLFMASTTHGLEDMGGFFKFGRKDADHHVHYSHKPLLPRGLSKPDRLAPRSWMWYLSMEVQRSGLFTSMCLPTRSTLREIGQSFPRNRVSGVREESRIREQDHGNFRDEEHMKELKKIRDRYGRFFYRFPEGESGADVYDRVSSFFESLWRDIDMSRLSVDPSADLNIVIVSHGIAIRVFLMRWFKWSAEQYESLKSLKNAESRVLELGQSGEYSLAIQHDDQTMKAWGLSDEMIEDQKQRATAKPGEYVWKEKSPWYLNTFFGSSDNESHLADGGKK